MTKELLQDMLNATIAIAMKNNMSCEDIIKSIHQTIENTKVIYPEFKKFSEQLQPIIDKTVNNLIPPAKEKIN